jgi:hypothetical protein
MRNAPLTLCAGRMVFSIVEMELSFVTGNPVLPFSKTLSACPENIFLTREKQGQLHYTEGILT